MVSDDWYPTNAAHDDETDIEEGCYYLHGVCDNFDEKIIFRGIEQRDRQSVQALHERWFPVKYDEKFYQDISNGTPGHFGEPLYTCVAVKKRLRDETSAIGQPRQPLWLENEAETEEIIASAVGTFLPTSSLPPTLSSRLISDDDKFTRLFYLMTLGCSEKYRNQGWGSTMVKHSLQHAQQDRSCGAVYLHVIISNHSAIRLYEKLGFCRVQEIVNYYSIEGKKHNCFLYAKHLNGNRCHFGVINFITNVFSSMWNKLIVVPMNFLVEVAGTNNSNRLM
jgi:ribosomal protein S18 acetylase RimI-like enzyme